VTISRPPHSPLQMHVHSPVLLVSGLRCDLGQDRSRAWRGAVRAIRNVTPEVARRRDRRAFAARSAVSPVSGPCVVRATVVCTSVSACADGARTDDGSRAGRFDIEREARPRVRTTARVAALITVRAAGAWLATVTPVAAGGFGGGASPGPSPARSRWSCGMRVCSPRWVTAAPPIATNSGSRSASGPRSSGEEVA
jgi:hypothetical protein